jgi:hypothetical protein
MSRVTAGVGGESRCDKNAHRVRLKGVAIM